LFVASGYHQMARDQLDRFRAAVADDASCPELVDAVDAARSFGSPGWLSTRTAKRRIVDAWRGATPVNDWLNRHVGPSTLPPDERR
jgi:hypothetical protein